ncbi:MAG: DUF4926 domain-containing protein [Eubacteriales bacterium]|nr:DUF4926 domain-containing protein [Eubacteriales bacterium]
MFELYDIVELIHDREDLGLKQGTRGTVIDYVKSDNVYSVEFYDETGETIESSIFEYYTPDELKFVERPI